MTSLWPGGPCDPCERDRHEKCVGWRTPGFCGCARGPCETRLITGVLSHITEPDNEGEP